MGGGRECEAERECNQERDGKERKALSPQRPIEAVPGILRVSLITKRYPCNSRLIA
jgi:hypothetical protein